MDNFISWSGDRSKIVAETLRDWLPSVIQRLKPWMSASDIDKGARWLKEISEKLEVINAGIICLTPENLNEPWILFETGALSKALDSSSVCPILLDLDPSSLKGPLSQFQATMLQKADILKFIMTLNNNLKDEKLPESKLEESFNLWWPKLFEKVENIPIPEKKMETERSEKDILLEILRIVRGIDRQATDESMIKAMTQGALATLTPLEEKVLRMRFGIGVSEDEPLEQINYGENVKTEKRIREIEAKALRKLRGFKL